MFASRAWLVPASLLLMPAAFGVVGCASGGDGRLDDAGPVVLVDAGPRADAGPTPDVDAGPPGDAGPPVDAGPQPLVDAGPQPVDGGPLDAGAPDAGSPTVSPACQAQLDAANATFETGSNGWVTAALDGFEGSGGWPYNEWALGAPVGGPGTTPDGTQTVGIEPAQNYAQCTRGWAGTPVLDLSACAGVTVVAVLQHWYDFWTGSYDGSTWYDGGIVETSVASGAWQTATPADGYTGTVRINPDRGLSYRCDDRNNFYVHNAPGYVGSSGGWETIEIPLPAASGGSTVQVRFAFGAGVSSSTTDADTSRAATRAGWYIDDFRLEAR